MVSAEEAVTGDPGRVVEQVKPSIIEQVQICRCGNQVVFSNELRCEDCFAKDSEIFSGRDSNVVTLPGPVAGEPPGGQQGEGGRWDEYNGYLK